MLISMLRTAIIYLVLLVAMRIMGKRQLGELEPSELATSVLIADMAATPLQDPGIPLLYGLVPVFTLLCFELFLSALVLKSARFRTILGGKPSMLIVDGIIQQEEMKKNRLTVDELCEELRKQDVTDISSVFRAVLETDGTLSVLVSADNTPVTGRLLGLSPAQPPYPVVVINNGRVMEDNLHKLGLNREWLRKTLRDRGKKSPQEVYLMTAAGNRVLYFQAKEK